MPGTVNVRICGKVGDNEPYFIEDDVDYSLPVHGDGRGLSNVMIELRQDGVACAADAAMWAERLATAWRAIEEEIPFQ